MSKNNLFAKTIVTQSITQRKDYLGLGLLDNPPRRSHLPLMRRSHALLVAILCALSLPARGQALILYRQVRS